MSETNVFIMGGEMHFEQTPDEKKPFEQEYLAVKRLLPRLKGTVHFERKALRTALREEETEELVDIVLSVLKRDPGLEHVMSDVKLFETWEKICKTLYHCLKSTNSDANVDRISTSLARVLSVADKDTNESLADCVVMDRLFSTWPWSQLKFRPKRTEITRRNETVFEKYFAQYNLDAKTIFENWYASHENFSGSGGSFKKDKQFHPIQTAYKNLHEMRRLELLHPGGPKMLMDNFGVYCFTRYPKGLLDEQLTHIDDTQTPYGLLIESIGDYSGYSYGSRQLNSLQSLQSQCKAAGVHLRVIEVANKRELARRLIFLEKTYHTPSGRKAMFGILSGHGNERRLVLGQSDKRRLPNGPKPEPEPEPSIWIPDVLSETFKKGAQRFFEEGASFVVASCCVGAEQGLAHHASKNITSLRIAAPPGAVYTVSYKLEGKVPGPLTLSATYKGMLLSGNKMTVFEKK